jgi:hypothetical protein
MLRRFTMSFVAAVLLILGMSQTTQAALVENLDGVQFSWVLMSDGTTADLSVNTSYTTMINGAPVLIESAFPIIMTADVSSQVGNKFDFLPTSYPGGFIFNVGGSTAVFDLMLDRLIFPNSNTAIILGEVDLVSNGSAEDFSRFDDPNPPGHLVMTMNTTPGTDLMDIVLNGGQVVGSGSFSIVAVPEPASIVIWGLLGVGLVAVAGRKRRTRRQTC